MSAHRAARPASRRSRTGLRDRITAFGTVIAISLAGTFTASVAWAFWSAGSLPGGNTTSTAATVAAGNTPTAVAAPTAVALNWAASTLSTGTAVSGYTVQRYDSTGAVLQVTGTGCSGLITTTSCTETGVPAGQWRWSITPRFATNWTGAESAKTAIVTTESTPPVNNIALSNLSGMAVKSGNTIYFHGSAGGSFTLTNALTDTGSGPASSATATLGGTSTGWTHTPGTVATPTGGPYVSSTFTWAAGTTSSPTEVVTGRDVLGNQATTTLTFVNDSTAPTGTVSYSNTFQPTASVSVSFSATDSGSGVATAQLQRASALYLGTIGSTSGGATNGSGCGTFSSFAAVGSANPTSPYVDTAVLNSTCYQYRYVVTDAVGNVGTITPGSTTIAIVDYAGAVNTTTGVVSQWRLGESSVTNSRAADSKGSNTGDYFGGVTSGIGGELTRDANTAIIPNGTTGYVQASTTSGLPTGSSSRSVELWFRTTSANRQVLFTYGSLATDQEFGLWLNAGGLTMTAWGYGVNSDRFFTMPAALNDGVWHQVVKTYDGTNITLYIDGAALTPQAATRSTTVNTNGFTIGAIPASPADANSGGYFVGGLDEVSVYSTALSAATVSAHYALGKNTYGDIAGPTGGSIAANGLVGTGSAYATALAGSVTFSKGTDAGSGLAPTGSRVMSATAPLTSAGGTANGTCGTFTAFSLVATDASSPAADLMNDQTCYSYQYVVPDTLFNYTRYAASTIVKVDTTPPTAAVTATAGTNSFVSGSSVYYRGSAAGSFTITSGATDSASGIASVSYPSLGTGWTAPGTALSQTYSWTANPAVASGAKNVAATNNAGLTSAASTFTPVLDNTAPTGYSIVFTGSGATRQASYVSGTDSGSGIASVVFERSNSLLCLIYGAYAPVTNPETVPGNLGCINYRLTVTDNVGNQTVIVQAA